MHRLSANSIFILFKFMFRRKMSRDGTLLTMVKRLIPGEVYADVKAGTSLVKCLGEIKERRAKHDERTTHTPTFT